MVNLAVIHYSQTGNVFELATAAAAAGEDAGAAVRLRKVAELAPEDAVATSSEWTEHAERVSDLGEARLDDLEWADAIMFGTPTRYGLPTSQLKQFIDQTGPLWEQGKLVDKVVSSFTSTATTHGGQETTIVALNNTFYHWGSIIVGPGYADPRQFEPGLGNPYGASHVAAKGPVGDDDRYAIGIQTRRVVDVAARLNRAG